MANGNAQVQGRSLHAVGEELAPIRLLEPGIAELSDDQYGAAVEALAVLIDGWVSELVDGRGQLAPEAA
jgi:hypothetical protein